MSGKDPFTHSGQKELTEALRSSDDETRVRAACAVGDQLRFKEIPGLDPALRDELVKAARDASHGFSDLRFEAAIALCEAHDPEGAALLDALDIKERRFDAVKALSRLKTEPVRKALAAMAERRLIPWVDRLVASAACAVLGDKHGARYFEKTLVSRWFPSRRAMALHLLGELRHPEAFAILMGLADSDQPARAVAIRALGHLGDKRAIRKLRAISARHPNDKDLHEDLRYALDLLSS
jgi:HEAT repeat protein